MPDPSGVALLRACLAPDELVGPRLREWERTVELDDIDGDALTLIPFLHQRIRAVGVPARDAGRIKGIYARAWVLDERSGGARSALADAPADGVLLRGVALRLLAYGGTAVRATDDTVVLVAGADRPSVLPSRDRLADTTADPLVVDRARASASLLADPGPDPGPNRGPEPDLGPAAKRGTEAKPGPRSPAPAYHLLDALLRRTGWFPDTALRPLLDAGVLAARMSAADWDLFVAETRRCRWGGLVGASIADLVAVGGAVPPDVLTRLAAVPDGVGETLVRFGSGRRGWVRSAARGVYGWYLGDARRARGPRALVDYPVRNGRHVVDALRRRSRAGRTPPGR